MLGYADLVWKDDKLYFGKKNTTVKLIQDEEYDFMYWLEWNFEKPEKSVNFYNLTNAKDNGKKLYLTYANGGTENGT
jgi:hypothetical protein